MVEQRIVDWLADADPAIGWQVQRDLLDEPEEVWQQTRARVATEGWGAGFLSHQDPDGQWAGGSFLPAGFTGELWESEGQPWTATYPTLTVLRGLGLDPSSATARRTTELLGANSRWDEGGQAFWDGEVEPCINGVTLANGAWFGADVGPIAERLLGDRLADGGWNCEDLNGAVVSSFDSTINVLEGLLAWQQVAGDADGRLTLARLEAEEYLLARGLFRRRSTGEVADPGFLSLGYPFRWHHSVLRGLDHFRRAAAVDRVPPDPRLGEAVDWLRSVRSADGTWPLQVRHGGRDWFDMERVGEPSRWITLYALRILLWWDGSPA